MRIQVTGENAPPVVVDGRQGVVIEARVGPVSSVNGRVGAVTGLAEAADVPNLDVANIRDYGAVPDGSDATAAVQAAIDAGGITYIPPGTFTVSTLKPKLGTVIQGVGRSGYIPTPSAQASTLKLKDGTNGPLIQGETGVSNVVIRNLNLDGNKAGNASGDIIHLDNSTAQDTAWHIEDCYLNNSANDGVFIGTGRQAVRISRTWIMRSDNNGAVINGNDAGFTNVLVGLSSATGIYIGASVQHLTDCDVWSSGGAGIVVDNATMVSLSGIGIDRHQREGLIVLAGDAAVRGCLFHSNSQLTNNTYSHIRADAGNVAVTGCLFGADGFANNPNYAITATDTARVRESTNIVASGSVVRGFISDVTKLIPDGPTVQPSDHGLHAWTFDPANAAGSSTMTAGTVYLAKVQLRRASYVTNLLATVGTAGATLTAGQCFAGLYNSSGTLIAGSADQATNWQSIGTKTMALTSGPYSLAAGAYYIALLANGATPPQFIRSNTASASMINVGLTVSTGRYITTETARTSLPASTTLGSASTDFTARWAALG